MSTLPYSKIPGDCSKAVSKSYEVVEDGVLGNKFIFHLQRDFSNIPFGSEGFK